MLKFKELDNPFTVHSPEDMLAEDVVSLFVDVFSDFYSVPNLGNVFLHGPRGSGKSMMFRFLQPDCQCIKLGCKFNELPFLSIYVPIKNTQLNLTELKRLENQHADAILNEHFMTVVMALRTFVTLSKCTINEQTPSKKEINNFISGPFNKKLSNCGWTGEIPANTVKSVHDGFNILINICEDMLRDIVKYFKKLSFEKDALPYNGPLCGYCDFLYPVLESLKELSFMPKGPLFLLIDDADRLSLTQTKVLNTWVYSRTSSIVSIKASTQFDYKTYRTTTGIRIDSPHDYSEVNIATIYTAAKTSKYIDRVREIVNKRLSLTGIEANAETFFPEDVEQEKKIKVLEQKYISEWQQTGRGNRPSDDALRYARPDFMKGLGGQSKSSPTYSYAGFKQLVHISSGIVRYFLEAAALMYNETRSKVKDKPKEIPVGIQDRIIRQYSTDFLDKELEKEGADLSEVAPQREKLKKLANLINALGGVFRKALISASRSERRIFSVAFSDEPSEEIKEIFKLGIKLGYFHESSIGNKEGTGRTKLYVLSRRLAPHYKLDPTSFAGYLFVTRDRIEESLNNPKGLLGRIKDGDNIDEYFEPHQLKLFEN